MLKIRFIIVFFLATHCHAQLYNSKWYFGGNAGLDFSTSPPTVIPNVNMNTNGGMSSVCDAAGNLLFYTDGATIWNNQHLVMANGSGINGTPGALQDVVIAPNNTNTSQYFVYTTSPFNRTIVDMSLAAGMGSVIAKNATIRNGTIGHVVAGAGCNEIQALTRNLYTHWFDRSEQMSSGGSHTSSANSFTPQGSYIDKWLKVSPDGYTYALIAEKPGSGTGFFTIEIRRFFLSDPNMWAAPIIVTSGTQLGNLFACEFSPDGTKLYASSPTSFNLYQWDLCAGTQSAIANSIFTISTGSVSVYGLQIAPDGKIYCATNPSLSVINNPDQSGSACGFTLHQQSIGTASCGLVLPNFCTGIGQMVLSPISFSTLLTPSVSCRSMTFTPITQSSYSNCAASAQGITSVKWNFGDPNSGTLNTSTVTNAIHVFSAPGTYTVKMVMTRSCKKDSITQAVIIPGPWPTVSLTGNFALCTNGTAAISAAGADNFSWGGNVTGSVFVVSPSVTTIYTVVGTNSTSGCGQQTTFTITVAPCTNIKSGEAGHSQRVQVSYQHGLITIQDLDHQTNNTMHRCRDIRVFDLTGRTVLTAKPEWHEGTAVISSGQIQKGIYLLSFEDCTTLSPIRFLVEE